MPSRSAETSAWRRRSSAFSTERLVLRGDHARPGPGRRAVQGRVLLHVHADQVRALPPGQPARVRPGPQRGDGIVDPDQDGLGPVGAQLEGCARLFRHSRNYREQNIRPNGPVSLHHRTGLYPLVGTLAGMDEKRARQITDALRDRGVNAHLKKSGVDAYAVQVLLSGGREAVWGSEGTTALEAEVLQDGDLVGFVPQIPGSADFDDAQIVDAIARADYDEPEGHELPEAPPPGQPLPREGGVFRRFTEGFRDEEA